LKLWQRFQSNADIRGRGIPPYSRNEETFRRRLGQLIIFVAAIVPPGEVFAADGNRPVDAGAEGNPVVELRKDAENGNEKAEYFLGCFYNGDNSDHALRDSVEAVKWWVKAATQGYADAQYCLGLSYYLGQGLPRDVVQAAKWWRKAADQDHPDAQYFLGLSYSAGHGVPKSPPLALYWLNRAAKQGNRAALEAMRKIVASPR